MALRSRFILSYLDPLEVESQINALVAEFPTLCRLETLPLLSHGYQGARMEAQGHHPIRVLRITAPGGMALKPGVLIMRSHHAREWINAMAVVEIARQLVENYRPDDTDSAVQQIVKTLENVEYFIVPESNPDGARLSFFDAGRRMWRKNLHPSEVEGCVGVDCNRNFPQFFGEAGSSASPCAETYRGLHALSEPESANLATLVDQHRNIIFAIDSHSYGQAIFRPSLHGGEFIGSEPISVEDDAIYQHLETQMNLRIADIQGIQYTTGSTSNHAGTTDEFFFFSHHIFAFDLECGRDFQPPIEEALSASLEVAEAAKALGWCATGETNLDVQGMIAHRQALQTDTAVIDDFQQSKFSSSWKVELLSKKHWRRYDIECMPLSNQSAVDQYQQLNDGGFDVVGWTEVGTFAIIASDADLSMLTQMGYQPVIKQDLYAETAN